MKLRRKTRESYRHERAVVRQQLGAPTAEAIRADIKANKLRADRMRRAANREVCTYCRQPLPSHTADCPVIS